MTHKLGLFTLVLMLGACSVETTDEAKQKCRDLVNDWCTRAIGCFVDSGDVAAADEAAEVSQCKQTGESSIDCAAAVSTSSNYDSCMNTVHSLKCSSIGADAKLPAQCNAVIEVAK